MLKLIFALVAVVSLAAVKYAHRPSGVWDEQLETTVESDLRDAEADGADGARIRDKIRLVYFAADWCPHCSEFTPELVGFYNANKGGEAFEVIFVSEDDSEGDMDAHMASEEMPWPTVNWASDAHKELLRRLAGRGIPDLVMIDADGNVISKSYRDGRYVGPGAVLNDLKELLK